MNKKIKLIMNIVIGIVGLAFLLMLIYMITSFEYAGREKEDPLPTDLSVFEYKLKHKAYNEILSTYYAQRLSELSAPEGYEEMFHVAEYAHTAFMSGIYSVKGDDGRIAANAAKREAIKKTLGKYAYIADEVDDMLK